MFYVERLALLGLPAGYLSRMSTEAGCIGMSCFCVRGHRFQPRRARICAKSCPLYPRSPAVVKSLLAVAAATTGHAPEGTPPLSGLSVRIPILRRSPTDAEPCFVKHNAGLFHATNHRCSEARETTIASAAPAAKSTSCPDKTFPHAG